MNSITESGNEPGNGGGRAAERDDFVVADLARASGPRRQRTTHRVRSAETQQKLRDAALECLAEFGYSGSSIVEIARRAGLTPSGIQHHFGGKAELMVASLKQIDDEAHALLEAMPAEGTFAERFRMVMSKVESFVKPTRAHVELRLAARSDSDLAACLSAYITEYAQWGDVFNQRMFADVGGGPEYFKLVVAAFTGLVINVGDPVELRAELVRLEQLLARYLGDVSKGAAGRDSGRR